MQNESEKSLRIWVDADACPTAVREILFRVGQRRGLEIILVANQSVWVPKSALIRFITVRDGADVADQTIVDLMEPGDVVITNDIPLAARVVEKRGVAIGPRGEVFDSGSVEQRLASRNVMEHLRSAGVESSGPKPLGTKDLQNFSNSIDRILTRLLQRRSKL